MFGFNFKIDDLTKLSKIHPIYKDFDLNKINKITLSSSESMNSGDGNINGCLHYGEQRNQFSLSMNSKLIEDVNNSFIFINQVIALNNIEKENAKSIDILNAIIKNNNNKVCIVSECYRLLRYLRNFNQHYYTQSNVFKEDVIEISNNNSSGLKITKYGVNLLNYLVWYYFVNDMSKLYNSTIVEFLYNELVNQVPYFSDGLGSPLKKISNNKYCVCIGLRFIVINSILNKTNDGFIIDRNSNEDIPYRFDYLINYKEVDYLIPEEYFYLNCIDTGLISDKDFEKFKFKPGTMAVY